MGFLQLRPARVTASRKRRPYRKVTYPTGMENWVAPGFDAAKSGWSKGWQPFGQLDGELAGLVDSCSSPFCRCGEKPKTLWEKEVLMVRGTFEFPALKDGHRYGLVLGGAAHVNSGEGYALYINGQLLAEFTTGVAVRTTKRGPHLPRFPRRLPRWKSNDRCHQFSSLPPSPH